MADSKAYEAFLKLQSKIPTIERNAKANVQGDKASYSYSYAPLEQIHKIVKPLIKEYGFILSYPMTRDELSCILTHVETGVEFKTSILFEQINDPRRTGGKMTMYQRYLIKTLLALDTDEDIDSDVSQVAKAKMTKEAYEACVKRIKNGENGVLNKALAYFELTQKQNDELLNLELTYND